MSMGSSIPPVTVLVVDDSSFMRAALSRMVESDKSLHVAGTAETGLEALTKIEALRPDVVTLDLDMPGLSGLETLRRIMAESPRPVIVISSTARCGAEDTIEALQLGAFECIAKALSYDSVDVLKVQNELVGKIKAAAGLRIPIAAPELKGQLSGRRKSAPFNAVAARLAPATTANEPLVIAIGASTGGPRALQEILSALPAGISAGIIIVQHMPPGFIGPFAKRLNDSCALKVHEAEAGDTFTAGHAYFAPAGRHLTVCRRSATQVGLQLSPFPGNLINRPSVDVMMTSVAEVFRSAAMGIILTGMGDDGALGMQAIFREGGLTVGQDQASCVVYGMPRSCADLGVLTRVVPLPEIPQHILAALRYRKPPVELTNALGGIGRG
jgi:two-component system, chemotaxis family, protein-glutamate methylesterase/glutaminase